MCWRAGFILSRASCERGDSESVRGALERGSSCLSEERGRRGAMATASFEGEVEVEEVSWGAGD